MTNLKRIAFLGLLMGMAFGVMAYAGQFDQKFSNTEEDRAAEKAEVSQVRTPANDTVENVKQETGRREYTRMGGKE